MFKAAEDLCLRHCSYIPNCKNALKRVSVLFFSTDAIYSFVWDFHQCFYERLAVFDTTFMRPVTFYVKPSVEMLMRVWLLDWEVYRDQWFCTDTHSFCLTHTHTKKKRISEKVEFIVLTFTDDTLTGKNMFFPVHSILRFWGFYASFFFQTSGKKNSKNHI